MDKEQFLEAITADLRTLLESNPTQQAQVCLTFSAPPSSKPVMALYHLSEQKMTAVIRVTGASHETHVFENVRLKDALMWPIAAKEM